MAKYAYQVKNSRGQTSQGEMDAPSEADVRLKLKGQNLEVLRLVARVPKAQAKKSGGFTFGGVKGKDLQIFTRQFATLINAGIPVVDSLKILSEGLRPGLLKEAASEVKHSLEGGRRLGDAMALKPKCFDRLYVNMIRAGEEAGILDTILNRLAIYIEKSEKIKSQVKGAMVYPAVIMVVAAVVITGILVFIIPKFTTFYASSGSEPPALTMMVVKLSDFLVEQWYYPVAALFVIPMIFSQWVKTPAGKETFDAIVFRLPIFGEVARKSSIARLSRTLSTLLSSGVGILEAIEISARTAGSSVIEKALFRCQEQVRLGKTLASQLMKDKIFPDMVNQMIAIGEQSGTMDVMLGKIADFYEDEVETAVKALTSVLEPLMMVILGSIIAVLVLAMYLPVFNMGDVVGK